jgi:hypothetical protein
MQSRNHDRGSSAGFAASIARNRFGWPNRWFDRNGICRDPDLGFGDARAQCPEFRMEPLIERKNARC